MVLYRKYRPQKIAELDIERVRERLGTVLQSGSLPHAFLFSGPKGTGKTSAARIIAKAINCEQKGKSFEPCNTCETCLSITQGSNVDILEIDAASNRGIDEIRDLKEKIRLAPSFVTYKTYIIDEVHMLTTEAFNALLKTLEEPPEHAIFVLATTEPEKLLPTIISRCVRFDFTKATVPEIVHSLQRVVKGEKLSLTKEDEFLDLIAQSADGSFRDATKILEQAVLEDSLTIEKLQLLLGMSASEDVKKFLLCVFSKDVKEALLMISQMEKKGVNFKVFTSAILHILHGLLLQKYDVETEKEKAFSDVKITEIDLLLRLFTRSYGEFRTTAIPTLPLEMAVVEWGEKGGNHV